MIDYDAQQIRNAEHARPGGASGGVAVRRESLRRTARRRKRPGAAVSTTAAQRAATALRPGGRPLVCELYVGRTQMPWWHRQAWRWDLTWQRVDVRERWTRWHIAGDFGYARTRAGAWWATHRAYSARTAAFTGRHDQDGAP